MTINFQKESWPLKAPFRTARHNLNEIETILVIASNGNRHGCGEAVGVDINGENPDLIIRQIQELRDTETDLDQLKIQTMLPPGGARNALDCALWDLKCKTEDKSIWEILGLEAHPVNTVYTIPIQSAAAMAETARFAASYPVLKIKLDAEDPIERVEAIRKARPDASLIIDCNQGWDFDLLQRSAPVMAELGVEMIEQPLKKGQDDVLSQYQAPLPLCADESCNTSDDLSYLVDRYQMINIKLDKTGGLTEALKLANEAHQLGMDLMVGNMLGTSLGMAPAFVIAQFCKYVDLDGPLLQKEDRKYRLEYDGPTVNIPSPQLWG